MREREIIQQTHRRLLDVTSTKEAIEIMADHYDILDIHPDPADSAHAEFEKSKDASQPIYSAMGELAWRRVTQDMSVQYSQMASLERTGDKVYKDYSPTLSRFMATMDAWLRPVLEDILAEAAAGEMPHAAIYEVMKPARTRGMMAAQNYLKPRALAAGREWKRVPEDAGEFFKSTWITVNLPVVTSSILGRAIAVNQNSEGNTDELVSRLLGDLDQINDLSSAVRGISRPILDTTDSFLRHYSLWEQAELTSEEFLSFCQKNPWCTAEEYHPSLKNGRLKNPGHCAADIRLSRPERFPVRPDGFLRQIGVAEPGEVTLIKLYVASSIVAARDNLLAVLPR